MLARTSARDRLVVRSTLDELVIVNLASWTVRSTHRLPRPNPEAYWLFYWVLACIDPSHPWIYHTDIRDRCLHRWDLDAADLSAPLACGLDLDYEWITYYGWPAFAPGTSEAPTAVPMPSRFRTSTSGLAVLALVATFVLSMLSLLRVSGLLRRVSRACTVVSKHGHDLQAATRLQTR
ncbi:hypothetical protein HRbin27_01155 [bacterium HR27]|nr:hypothetical protein HRbin27_01155 [bacterium HR27]